MLPEVKEFDKAETAGNAAFQQQNYQEALTQYEKALAWSPWDPGMAHNLSLHLCSPGGYQQSTGAG